MIKKVMIVILIVCVLTALIIFGIDFAFYIKNILSKYHIGKWKNNDEWENMVYNTAVKWVYKTPTVKITDNSRYVLFDILNGKYRSISIQSWQTAALLLALLEKGDKCNAKKAAEKYINSTGEWIKKPVAVDSGLLSYAIMKSSDDFQLIKPAMDFMMDLITKHIDKSGLICYNGGNLNPEKYVDTLGLVCPFITCYANLYCKPEYEKLAFQQLKFYHDYGLLSETNLPNHAINSETKLPLGVYGWGRGTAWYIIGVLGTYIETSDENIKSIMKNWIYEAAESYMKFQKENGGFGSILQRNSTYDSSVTSVMAYFYLKCAEIFNDEKYIEIAQKSLKRIKMVTRRDGSVDLCQGDTKGIGIFAQHYDIMPFAQGFTLMANELNKKVKQ